MSDRRSNANRAARRVAAACLALGVCIFSAALAGSAEAVDEARLPRTRPDPAAATLAAGVSRTAATIAAAGRRVASAIPQTTFGFRPDPQLKAALDALSENRYEEARALAGRHPDPLAAELVGWLIGRASDSGLSALDIIRIIDKHPHWPERERLTLRAEQAFHALAPSGAEVLTFYSRTPPRTVGGNLVLAAALRDAGRGPEADAIVRDLWREWPLASNQIESLLVRFGASLRRDDHIYRYRRLVLNARTADAVAQAKFIGPGHDELARAVIAVLDRKADGARLLSGVAGRFAGDPLYDFARIRLLRRADKPAEAATVLLGSKADSVLPGDADLWWDERRDLSRQLLDLGKKDIAFRVAAENRAAGEAARAEAAFHAGWYALRFLGDAERAEPYFRDLIALATLPRTRARASYWLGRTFEAKAQSEAARIAYGEAAQLGGTFYGQLAREKLGLRTTGMERTPPPSALDRRRFADRDNVRAIRLLVSAGYADRAHPFFQGLAQTIDSPGEITLLTALARRIGQPRAAMNAATLAEKRGLQVASLPAPFLGVPTGVPLPALVDRALVYSVVRQESAFNHQATSHVGAQGLMQLMPATAKATARRAQLPFSVQRLTSDARYNATLGAHHLGELLDSLDRSYILTFVAYNAGPGRARDWVRAYGDPRGGGVDAVDWIERIPFDETRNYVQKVMENLQIYRSRSGHPLSLGSDLIRGGPQG